MVAAVEMDASGKGYAIFAGKPAWHDLGTVYEVPPTWAQVQGDGPGMGPAGLRHTVSLGELFTAGGTKLKGRCVIRSDGQIVGEYVSSNFAILQPSEIGDWIEPFLASGVCSIEAAGLLREGSVVWVLLRVVGASADIVTGDPVELFVLIAHAYDGTMALRAGFTKIRVVCMNTLSAALSEKSGILSIRHTGGMHAAFSQAQDLISAQMAKFGVEAEEMRALAKAPCNDEQAAQLIRQVFQPSADPTDPKVAKTQVNRILPLFQGAGTGLQLPGVSGTYWAAFNAVTEFLTHGRGRSDDTRVDSNWFGQGAEMTQRAYRVARANAAGRSMALSA